MKEKAIVLYSGGLDSRLAVTMMKKDYDVLAVHFDLPFGCSCEGLNFLEKHGIKYKVFDVRKGGLLKEFLEKMKNAKHGRGTGFNACRDCKIWMFKKTKEFADEQGIKTIASGEVPGQRPMSQVRSSMEIIDNRIGFEMKRPLEDLGFRGRRRENQMKLAEELGIDYPSPGGGCLLCEKALEKRFEVLIEKDLITSETLSLIGIGRHYFIDGWFVVGRNEEENGVIEKFRNCVKSGKGKPAVYFHEKEFREEAERIQRFYEEKDKENIKGLVECKL